MESQVGRRTVTESSSKSVLQAKPNSTLQNWTEVRRRNSSRAPANAANPFWSADGDWIYFSTERPDVIWKTPAEGGTAVRLTEEGRFVPQELADGSRIFFYRAVGGKHQVWSASVDGTDEHPVIGMPADVGWTLARAGIYFIDGPPLHSSIYYFDLSTTRVRKVAELSSLPMVAQPEISPDGGTLLFTAIEQPEADIVLVEGFN